MNRPLETTFWMRFKQFVKGVFLYNTIYWRRASDDLDIKRMSREERANLRPIRNLDIIRPRENPRPIPTTVLTLPPDAAERSYLPAEPEVQEPARSAPSPRIVPAAAGEDSVEIHRRKKRRRSRHSQVMPKKYYEAGGGGILGWLFRK